jgi:SnoaL-like domain
VRASLAFFLLTLPSAALFAGCGGGDAKSPEEVVLSWSQALNVGDDEAAAGLFADGAVVQAGRQTTLTDHEDALAFNALLPCGAKIVKQSLKGDEVTATFTLTRRPDHMCDDTGETTVVVVRMKDGKITLWHQLPSG